MIIGNFNPLDLRTDKGALWENFLVSERVKQNNYKLTFARMYFWRTKQQQEIDFVEERNGVVSAFEFKWTGKGGKFPSKFIEAYQAKGILIDRSNFREFVKI
jgi:predicted AAA+ superfamily ATPase